MQSFLAVIKYFPTIRRAPLWKIREFSIPMVLLF
uniref:ABC transporter permease n=1 Tax=Ascaris lumbricoides TaxID=6252 RepID=A0A0M3HHK5_ASCLU